MPDFAKCAISAGILFVLAGLASGAQADVYPDAGASVLSLEVSGAYREPQGGDPYFQERGSGYVITSDGYVLTAAHLIPDPALFVDDALLIEGRFPQLVDNAMIASGPLVRLRLINRGSGSENDVALLKIETPPDNLSFLRSCEGAEPDAVVRTLGYTFTGTSFGGGGILSIVRGEVSTPSVRGSPMRLNTRGAPGLSGGPVFGVGDRVVGIFLGEERTTGDSTGGGYATASRALPSRRAFEVVAPDNDGLRGRSYSEDCASFAEELDRVFADVESRRILLTTPLNSRHEVVAEFQAPRGTQFVVDQTQASLMDTTGFTVENARYEWSNDRTRLTVTSEVSSAGFFQVYRQLQTAVRVPLIPTAPEVRGFSIERSFAERRLTTFLDEIPAPEGYEFVRVMAIEPLVLEHASHPTVDIENGGGAMRVSYRMDGRESSPARIEFYVHAMIAPITGSGVAALPQPDPAPH